LENVMRQFLSFLWSHLALARGAAAVPAIRSTRLPAAIEHQRERRALAVAGSSTTIAQAPMPACEFAATQPISAIMIRGSQHAVADTHGHGRRIERIQRPERCERQARASWVTFDPQDMRRAVIAGRMSEVCAVLEQLTLMSERSGVAQR
jgi:hypothetical protein